MENSKKGLIIGIILVLIIMIGFFLWYFLRKEVYKKVIGLPENVIFMKEGEIKLLPFEADEDKDIIFESSNPDIAKIDRQGYIYAYKVGKTEIKVYYADDNRYAVCEVHVTSENGTPYKDSEEKEKITDPPLEEVVTPPPVETKPQATCKLNVSKDGMITSTNKNAIKYGFDKDHIDSMEISKHILDIPNKEEKQEEGWTYYRIRYYVQNEEGKIGNCAIVVVKKCDNTNTCVYEVN